MQTSLDIPVRESNIEEANANATHYVFNGGDDADNLWEYFISVPRGTARRGDITPIETQQFKVDSMMSNHDHPDKTMHGKVWSTATAKRQAADFVFHFGKSGGVILTELTGMARGDVKKIFEAILLESSKIYADWLVILDGATVRENIAKLPKELVVPAEKSLVKIRAAVEQARAFKQGALGFLTTDYNTMGQTNGGAVRKVIYAPEVEAFRAVGMEVPTEFHGQKKTEATNATELGVAIANALAERDAKLFTEMDTLRKQNAELQAKLNQNQNRR